MALPTKTLGPYGLGELIAVGGMARTYRAWRNNESDFPLCIKLLHGELGENIDFIKMFIDEATIAQSLKHPNVVRVYELGRSDENHYIVMELVEGKDLKQIAERASRRGTRMTPMMVAATIHDICRALSYVHNKTDDNGKPLGIIHRDVSPHNIMLTFEGARVKLTDFGIAKAASRLTRTRNGAVKGKYGYMSPEQAQGQNLDGRSDLFAVGIIMHELLTGQRLFQAETSFEAFAMVLEQPILAPSTTVTGIDPELDRICLKALDRDLTSRYRSCHAMATDLRGWLDAHIPNREATGLEPFLKTLFDLEQGQLPRADVVHDPKLAHMADLHTQVIPPSPLPMRSSSVQALTRPRSEGTQPAVWQADQNAVIAEALSSSSPVPAVVQDFSSTTHTDIFNPHSHLHDPTDHGFRDEAYGEHIPPNLDRDIGDIDEEVRNLQHTIPVDIPPSMIAAGQANTPQSHAAKATHNDTRVQDQPPVPAPQSSPPSDRPRISAALSAMRPKVPKPAPPKIAKPKPKLNTKPSTPPQRIPPSHTKPGPSVALWLALAGVLLLAMALVMGVALLIITMERDDAVAHTTESGVEKTTDPTDDPSVQPDDTDPSSSTAQHKPSTPDEKEEAQGNEDDGTAGDDNTGASDEDDGSEDDDGVDGIAGDDSADDGTADDKSDGNEDDGNDDSNEDDGNPSTLAVDTNPTTTDGDNPTHEEDSHEGDDNSAGVDADDDRLAVGEEKPDETNPEETLEPAGAMVDGAGADTSEDADTTSKATLKRKQKEAWRSRATLTINAKPWAEISIDGRSVGKTPKQVRLRPGSYTILLQNPELQRAVRKKLTLNKGETRTISHVFK